MAVAEKVTETNSDILTDVGSERNFLACLMKSEEAWMKIPDSFGQEDLSQPLNRAMWIIVDSLYEQGARVDPITVTERLPSDMQRELEQVGGWGYIETLQNLPIDPMNIELEINKLSELTTRRRISKAGGEISEMATDSKPIDSLIERIETVISDIEGGADLDMTNIGSKGLEYVTDRMAHPAEVPGLPSGMLELDRTIQGFQSGRLYVIAARKKTGKSVILLNWAKHMALDCNIPVLWISTEHSQDDEYSRLLSLTSDVWETHINNGIFTELSIQVERVQDAVEKISDSPLIFKSMPHFNLNKLRRLIRKAVRVNKVQAVFFDYIKPPSNPNPNNAEWQELGTLTFGLKAIAETEGIPVITACQLNREAAMQFKLDGDVDSDSFAGSDRISHALSVGMVLRKLTNKEQEEYRFREEDARILKITDNRHGPASYKSLVRFDGNVLKMEEIKRV